MSWLRAELFETVVRRNSEWFRNSRSNRVRNFNRHEEIEKLVLDATGRLYRTCRDHPTRRSNWVVDSDLAGRKSLQNGFLCGRGPEARSIRKRNKGSKLALEPLLRLWLTRHRVQ
jgi:hypothetical protein